jgi:hypothetical protein
MASWAFLVLTVLYVAGHVHARVWLDSTHASSQGSASAFKDFDCYLTAAENLTEGKSIYRLTEDFAPASPCISHDLPEYVYSPALAVLLVPMTWTEPCLPERIWFGANVMAALALIPLLLIALRIPFGPASIGLAILVVGAPMATLENLALGQVNLFLMIIMIGGWVFVDRGRSTVGTTLIVVATLLKSIPILLGAELIRRRAWRAACAALCVGVAVLVLLFVAIPVDGPGDFLEALALKSNQNLTSSNNVSIQAGIARGTGLEVPGIKVMNTIVALLVLAIALYPALSGPSRRDSRWLLALYPALCLALTPRLEAHHFVLLYPALILLVYSAFTRPRSMASSLEVIGVAFVFVCLNSRGFDVPDYLPELLGGLLEEPAGIALWCLILWLLNNWMRPTPVSARASPSEHETPKHSRVPF